MQPNPWVALNLELKQPAYDSAAMKFTSWDQSFDLPQIFIGDFARGNYLNLVFEHIHHLVNELCTFQRCRHST
jgi:hypothetical protein